MSTTATPQRIVVGISGASGAVYGRRLLQALRETQLVQTHLVVSDAGWIYLAHESDLGREAVQTLVDEVHDVHDLGASIASGSFACAAMLVALCPTLVRRAHWPGVHDVS